MARSRSVVKVAIPQRLGSNPPRNAIRFSGGDSINDLSQGDYDRVRSATQPFSVQPFSGLTSRASSGHHSRMNPTSLTFAIGMASLIALTGWFIDWGAGKPGVWSIRKRRIARIVTVLATVIVGIYVYRSDARLRGTTLFEVAGPWEENGARIWTVEVEHPGIEHTLMIYPFTEGFDSAARPVTLRARFGEKGGAALIDQTFVHETTRRSGKNASGYTWVDVTHSFTPPRAGVHELLVESVDGVVPVNLHLRITDPEKRDGKRAPGY
jgi:hypothetical protein